MDQILHTAPYPHRHFGKWLPRPPGAKSVVAKYPDLFIIIMSFYKCAKFGAFITKCTIG